jgi:predicted ATPase/DNA-binding CsgD family transcriptional regulator
LRQAEVGLLTLTGPPGVGKTRLGLAVAGDLRPDFAGGVFFVDLAPISNPDLVVSAIAGTLQVPAASDQPLIERLQTALRDRQLLLLLDNFEQVLPATPAVVALLAACPQVKILVTSRAALRVRGEHDFPVTPLALPDLNHLLDVETLSQVAGVQLFVERAKTVQPDFALTSANAATIAEISIRLDGLPLAIELAAARIKLFSPQMLLAQLQGASSVTPLRLLGDGARDLSPRQQTLRDAIAWSYELLDSAEQMLFRRLAVFAAGFTLEAAEAVCSHGDAPLQLDMLRGIGSLVDKSLLRPLPAPSSDRPAARFGMLEMIRAFALEELKANGELAAIQQWHALYFLELAEQSAPALLAAEQVEWLARLEADHANLRAALSWTVATDAVELTARFSALCRFWVIHGHLAEGRRWLEPAVSRRHNLPGPLRARLLKEAGTLAMSQGDFTAAQTHYAESLQLYRAHDDLQGAACVLNNLGVVARNQGDLSRASLMLEESVALLRRLGNQRDLAHALNSLGAVARHQGDTGRARAYGEEALAIHRERANTYGIVLALNSLALVAYEQGDHCGAQPLYAESLSLIRDLGDRQLIALLVENVANLAGAQGQPVQALRLMGAAQSIRRAIGTPVAPVGRAEDERTVARARSQLGDEASTAAWSAGQALAADQALDEALAYVTESARFDTRPCSPGVDSLSFAIAQEMRSPQAAAPGPDSGAIRGAAPPTGGSLDVDQLAKPLTRRELEVLRLVAEGLSNKQIAAHLVLSPLTVGAHLASIYGKLQVTSRTAAVHRARHLNLL